MPLIITTNPGGGETGLLQTGVALAVCYVPGYDTIDDGTAGAVTVDAVGRAL